MEKHQEKKRKKDLGIFYTPPEVVEFIYDILNIWKVKEEKETGRWESRKRFPSVIDPACGEGTFLKKAIQSKFTKIPYIFGADIDIKAFESWSDISLSSEFKKSKANMRNFFFHQDGLSILKHFKHKYHYRGIKKDDLNQFDAVVGNPPYGGIGINQIEMISELFWGNKKNYSVKKKHTIENLFGEKKEIEVIYQDENISIPQIDRFRTEELKRLCQNLINSEIWQNKDKRNNGKLVNYCKKINGVDFYIDEVPSLDQVQKLKNFPIEILFLNRFIQLTKPGGWIAIIIPDGILTNSNSHFVREFVAERTRVEAIISLPRETFKQAGTNAKTSIMFLRKLKENEKPSQNYPVFLASVEKINKDNFQKIAEFYQKLYNLRGEIMNKTNLVQITKDQNDEEVAMVRADKMLKEMMNEKPASRWDPEYWHVKFDDLFKGVNFDLLILEKYILPGTEGITYGSTKPREWAQKGQGVKYIKSVNVRNTGIDIVDIFWTPEGGKLDGQQYRVKVGDIIMNKSGTGTFGRLFVMAKDFGKIVVSQDTMRIRVNDVSPYYVAVYIQTELGKKQVDRLTAGVSGQVHIDFEDIKAIRIPFLSNNVQQSIESEYKKMSAFHDKAMEAKKNNNVTEYKKNIGIAEEMLKDLIARTEAVIRGERKDII